MKTEINLIPSQILQPSFWNLANSRARFCVAYGGAGAGKSFATAQKVILHALRYSNRKIICIRKYGPALRLTCYTLIIQLLNKYKIPYYANKTDMVVELGQGSQILFIPIVNSSGEPAERLKSLSDVHLFWIEEPTELSYGEFKMIRLRLRGETLTEGYRQIILTFNPIDRNHWLHKYFFEPDNATKQFRESDRLKYSYKDNKFLDAEFISELESLKNEDAIAYQVYALGEWGVLTGQIYTNYVIEEFQHPTNYFDDVFCGVDFGFENPSALIIIGVKEKNLYIIDEIYKRKLINTELIKLIQNKLDSYSFKNLEIFCDTAEPARIEEMKRAGLNVKEANKNVIEGINVVKKYRQIIHPRCIEYIKEIGGYKRKEDKNGNVLEEPVKFNDHLCFVAGTKILILNGWKNIENIRCGDSILTRSGTHLAIVSGQTGFEDVINITFSNGISLIGTGNHPIWIEGKGFIRLDTLRYGDKITICTAKQLSLETFQKDAISTTKMETPITTQSQILNVSQELIICQNLRNNIIKRIQQNLKNIWMKLDRLQKNGIVRKMAENGIHNMEKRRMQNESRLSNPVTIVEKNIRTSIEVNVPGSVQMPVNLHGDDLNERMMKQGFVSSVPVSLGSIDMLKPELALENVRVLYLVKLKRKQIVYNLEVETAHEYFANGLLVSNCDAARYCILTALSGKTDTNRFLTYASAKVKV